jgi:uncharacterized membrane protein YqjE
MKISNVLAFFILLTINVLAVWFVIFSRWIPKDGLEIAAIMAFYLVAPLGGFWMLFDSLMHEKPPFPYVLLSFVGYGFIWYYFNRVRRRNRISNRPTTDGY